MDTESGEAGMDRSKLIKVVKNITRILGVMIVALIAMIGYRLFFNTPATAPTLHENAAAPGTVPSAPQDIVDYSAVALDQPAGSQIVRTAASGNWVYLTVSGGGAPDRVIVVDIARGRVISTIGLGSADSLPPRPGR